MDLSLLNFINHPMVGTPYGAVFDLAIVLAITCWLLSIITREYSWVDRVWPMAPAIFFARWLLQARISNHPA